MITVELLGGLGNQLFQAAYGMALQARGHEVGYCVEHLQTSGHKVYSLDNFMIRNSIRFMRKEDYSGPVVSESGMPFKPEMLTPPDPSVIYGYFQSEKYLKGIENEVRAAFEPAPLLPVEIATLGRKMRSEPSVAIHVRRGDYVGLQHFHGLMPAQYYGNALELISKKEKSIKAYVFSDDIDWCKLHFVSECVSTGSKLWDLWLFSQARHAIVANSSYSWWGAWLSPFEGDAKRTVVAPKNWFVDKNTDSRDIVPDRWVKL